MRKIIGCLAKGDTVPFEASKLTMLLKNYLVGNCKTRILVTVSAAASDYNSTLTNLRYAQLIKNLETCPVVNEDAQEKLIVDIRGELEKLKENMKQGVAAESQVQDIEKQRLVLEMITKENNEHGARLKRQLEFFDKSQKKAAILASSPFLMNVSQDELLTSSLKVPLEADKELIIGRATSNSKQDLRLRGGCISQAQSSIQYDEKSRQAIIFPNKVDPHKFQTRVNGESVLEPRPLKHGDHILFGSCNFFAFVDPKIDQGVQPSFEELFKEAYADNLATLSEVEQPCHDVILKVAEANLICQELGKTSFFYDAVVHKADEKPKVAVQLSVDRSNKKANALLTEETFSEVVFFDLISKHAQVIRKKDIDLSDIDDSCFGFDKDVSYQPIGDFFIFLTTIYNMIDFKLDRTPIIDAKGQEQGHIRYSLSFQIFDTENDVEIVDFIEYETMSELKGKQLRLNFEIKDADGLPQKLCSKTYCKYKFIETKEHAVGSKKSSKSGTSIEDFMEQVGELVSKEENKNELVVK